MARVSYVSHDQLSSELRPIVDAMTGYGPFANQVAAIAHRPPILRHLYPMLLELREESTVSRRHIELAVVVVSRLNECTYCVAHHAPVLEVEGVSAEGIERLLDYADHPELDDADKAVVEYAIQVTRNPGRIRDVVFERLRAHFSDPQIVELTWRIALCGAFNRFNDALQLEIEPEALRRVG